MFCKLVFEPLDYWVMKYTIVPSPLRVYLCIYICNYILKHVFWHVKRSLLASNRINVFLEWFSTIFLLMNNESFSSSITSKSRQKGLETYCWIYIFAIIEGAEYWLGYLGTQHTKDPNKSIWYALLGYSELPCWKNTIQKLMPTVKLALLAIIIYFLTIINIRDQL